jgi:hypothetical protein
MGKRRTCSPPPMKQSSATIPTVSIATTQLTIPKTRSPFLSEPPINMKATFTVVRGANLGAVTSSRRCAIRFQRDETPGHSRPLTRYFADPRDHSYASDEFSDSILAVNGTLLNGSKVSDYALRNGDNCAGRRDYPGFRVVMERLILERER